MTDQSKQCPAVHCIYFILKQQYPLSPVWYHTKCVNPRDIDVSGESANFADSTLLDTENNELQQHGEPSPRSIRRGMLDEKVANLPLSLGRKLCAFLHPATDLVQGWRYLAERLGLEHWEIRDLERRHNPAGHVIQKFNSSTDGKVRTFLEYMEAMERQDVIDVIYEWMDKKCPFGNTEGEHRDE